MQNASSISNIAYIMSDVEDIIADMIVKWVGFAVPGERIFVLYLLAAFIIAQLNFLYFKSLPNDAQKPDTSKGFWHYVFSKDIYGHPSAQQDYKYFIVNAIIYTLIFAPLLLSVHMFAGFFTALFEGWWGIPPAPYIESSPYVVAAYTVVSFLLFDFAIFFVHWLHHKIPVLWQFHKVHHSAEVLTPLTLYRMHPLDVLLTGSFVACLTGLALAGFFYLTGQEVSAFKIMNVNILIFVFYIMGYNLRHSHIWLNYPKWLSFILVSPAQHQIHHSINPKHFDKNMGLTLSIWDGMFGTRYIPEGYEDLKFGLSKKEPNPFKSVWALYVHPFIWAGRLIKKNVKSLAVMGVCVALYIGVFAHQLANSQSFMPPSVHMEELTWTEISKAQQAGYDSVIIPTGGTEQNGAHVVLGKHNYVVRYAAGEIARQAGKMFVAPVIAYVPEEPHMNYTGTVSVSESTFKALLTETAISYKRHGFKNIYLIGDSAGNQDGQKIVASELTKMWAAEGVQVVHISSYYSGNGQKEWLMQQGYSMAEIGGHAGIRDTSEMMLVHPEGVHSGFVRDFGQQSGASGDIKKASREYGQKMIDLKVQAALRQIAATLDK